MRTQEFAKRKTFRRTGAVDAADLRDENAAAYRRPKDVRIRRTQWEPERDVEEASRGGARQEAAPETACTNRSLAPACVRRAQSIGAKRVPAQITAPLGRVR